MNIKSVFSSKATVEDAVIEIKSLLIDFDVKMLVFFASSSFNPDEISKKIDESFQGAIVFGCSTSGELVSGKMLKNSVVAMAFNSNMIADAKIEVVENIRKDGDINKAFVSFEKHFKEPVSKFDTEKYAGIVLIDGLSTSEETIMDKIGDHTNCTFIGGSAGDDLKFSKTYVYANGIAYTNAAILVMFKSKLVFDIIKTQSFTVLDKKLIATKVDPFTRKVMEFDHQPAVEAYANALGVPKEKAPNYFMTNPVGLVIENDIFVRSPQRIVEDGIIFYCNILEDMEVSLLQSQNIIIDTKAAIENKKDELGSISGLINFNCILRTLELEQKDQTEAYGKIFSDIPMIGFSTYGEEYLGHMNQTATILLFK